MYSEQIRLAVALQITAQCNFCRLLYYMKIIFIISIFFISMIFKICMAPNNK